jgi:predicted RND superfamily exporter protein
MHETRKSLAERCIDILIDYRWVLAGILFAATAVLSFFVGGVTRDPSMRSGIDTTSRAYQQYQDFMDHFGSEEFILIVLNQGRQAGEPEALKSVQAITRGLEGLDTVTEISTSAVLFFAFLVLVMSPFRPEVSFGILGAGVRAGRSPG